jgi:hypothetical protein
VNVQEPEWALRNAGPRTKADNKRPPRTDTFARRIAPRRPCVGCMALRLGASSMGRAEAAKLAARCPVPRDRWRPALERAGLRWLHWHDLRHAHATWPLAAGVPVRTVQKRLAHLNLATNEIYPGELTDILAAAERGELWEELAEAQAKIPLLLWPASRGPRLPLCVTSAAVRGAATTRPSLPSSTRGRSSLPCPTASALTGRRMFSSRVKRPSRSMGAALSEVRKRHVLRLFTQHVSLHTQGCTLVVNNRSRAVGDLARRGSFSYLTLTLLTADRERQRVLLEA